MPGRSIPPGEAIPEADLAEQQSPAVPPEVDPDELVPEVDLTDDAADEADRWEQLQSVSSDEDDYPQGPSDA